MSLGQNRRFWRWRHLSRKQPPSYIQPSVRRYTNKQTTAFLSIVQVWDHETCRRCGSVSNISIRAAGWGTFLRMARNPSSTLVLTVYPPHLWWTNNKQVYPPFPHCGVADAFPPKLLTRHWCWCWVLLELVARRCRLETRWVGRAVPGALLTQHGAPKPASIGVVSGSSVLCRTLRSFGASSVTVATKV